jgi:hypothetical protein
MATVRHIDEPPNKAALSAVAGTLREVLTSLAGRQRLSNDDLEVLFAEVDAKLGTLPKRSWVFEVLDRVIGKNAKRAPAAPAPCIEDIKDVPRKRAYRPWAELLRRTFGFDVLSCPRCEGRMRLLAMVTDPKSIARYLRALGEPTDAPPRTAAREPPYWKSRVLRRAAVGEDEAAE